jgi:hypothetical protein
MDTKRLYEHVIWWLEAEKANLERLAQMYDRNSSPFGEGRAMALRNIISQIDIDKRLVGYQIRDGGISRDAVLIPIEDLANRCHQSEMRVLSHARSEKELESLDPYLYGEYIEFRDGFSRATGLISMIKNDVRIRPYE